MAIALGGALSIVLQLASVGKQLKHGANEAGKPAPAGRGCLDAAGCMGRKKNGVEEVPLV